MSREQSLQDLQDVIDGTAIGHLWSLRTPYGLVRYGKVIIARISSEEATASKDHLAVADFIAGQETLSYEYAGELSQAEAVSRLAELEQGIASVETVSI